MMSRMFGTIGNLRIKINKKPLWLIAEGVLL